jgi:hypothetical protein
MRRCTEVGAIQEGSSKVVCITLSYMPRQKKDYLNYGTSGNLVATR